MRSRRDLLTALMVTGGKVARARFRRSRGTWEPVVTMSREMPKWKTHKDKSPEAWHRGGSTRSSVEPRECGRSEGVEWFSRWDGSTRNGRNSCRKRGRASRLV